MKGSTYNMIYKAKDWLGKIWKYQIIYLITADIWNNDIKVYIGIIIAKI